MTHTTPHVLVVGDVTTPAGLIRMHSIAHEVADRYQWPAVVAVGRDYRVTDYAVVVFDDATILGSVDSTVLWVEACDADMPVLEFGELEEEGIDFVSTCGWCGEVNDDEPEPVRIGDVFYPSEFCGDCIEGAYAESRQSELAAA
ncbi:hypothetical protein [Streptomyces hydrogenans]|uniref:hypothetical protein n=1 Tax=Streptomyces hydrogenans TaxID=1873719 RepID=UPI0035DCA06F